MARLLGGSQFLFGFAAGFGTGVMAREIYPHFKGVSTPILKVVLKSSITLGERVREVFAHMGESIQDTFAEVQEDLRTEKNADRKIKKKRAKKKSSSNHDSQKNIIDLNKRRSSV